jgi:hypothetical protein
MDNTYKSEFYDDLPEILPAYQRLATRQVIPLIQTAIRQVFVDHLVEGVFGVRLLHRHFNLSKTERMVQYGAVAMPWDDPMISGAEKSGVVRPCNWVFRDSVAYPYEYIYQPATAGADRLDLSQHSDFLVAYYEVLRQNQLLDILGLALVDQDTSNQISLVEMCLERERAAINFPAANDLKVVDGPLPKGAADIDVTVPAAWFFSSSGPKVDGCGAGYHGYYRHCGTHYL